MSNKVAAGIVVALTALTQTALAKPRPARASCTNAATHIVDVALVPFASEVHGDAVAKRRAAEVAQIDAQCRDDRWSDAAMKCVAAATTMDAIRSCVPKDKPVDIAPLKGKDLSCARVGNHVADLMVTSAHGLEEDNVAISVTQDPVELHTDTVDACKDDHWSEDLRRCFAKATRFAHVVSCHRD